MQIKQKRLINMVMNTDKREMARKIQQKINQAASSRLNSVNTYAQDGLQDNQIFLWETAKELGGIMNDQEVSEQDKTLCRNLIAEIRTFMGIHAEHNTDSTTVIFGTSGWRGIIGQDFTLLNVHKVVRAIIEMMQTPEFLGTVGFDHFDQVKEAGILVFRDNRFMGNVFKAAAMQELAAAGIRIYDAGECPTGVGSALLRELQAAGSINFTPSHNPMDYAGIKFNPADGGPADKNLTTIIEEKANRYMAGKADFEKAETDYDALRQLINARNMFTDFVEQKSVVFNLQHLRNWLRDNKHDLFLLIDNMHGASRGYIEALLGDTLMTELRAAAAVQFINTNDDFAFHGVKPEPNPQNQKQLMDLLKQNERRFTLAVALDPDADRIRYADAHMDMDMNRFGAVAYATLLKQGITGGLASTAPSSDFALEIARRNGQQVFETAVGFKHFREVLSSQKAVMAFEESDGISFIGHTLEKCALAGFLAAIQAMASRQKNLSEIYLDLQKNYGFYYPGKAGTEVKGVSVEKWQQYKQYVLQVLQERLLATGDSVSIGGADKAILDINTIDGLKLIFEDKSWILLRPSGTEPKFRYYYEIVSNQALQNAEKHASAYEKAAAEILQKAREIVDR
ncbi:MAG: phosphomannomutase [Caldithrix sp.]|nr:phosphomannomutase [Caldithrix sp.]